jgi:beta-lactamase superfamily II metal-dependent hydrolase
MDRLRIRIYNVLFGDAILISVPDRAPSGDVTMRQIAIDIGNVLRGQNDAGADGVFLPIMTDILQETGGKPLDLYIMTHEHMDHIQGPLYCIKRFPDLPPLQAHYAWLTASAEPGYYDSDNHARARKKVAAVKKAYQQIKKFSAAAPAFEERFSTLLKNNNMHDAGLGIGGNPNSSADCVAHLRALAPAEKTSYVYRGIDLTGKHPFDETRFEIWAPEEDTADYYGVLKPVGIEADETATASPLITDPTTLPPPIGVDASAFYTLLNIRQNGVISNLLAIDKAANNTSVVFMLEWRGYKLLFTGDAEVRSWKTMKRQGVLKSVHFLKISHHGSHNGTPFEYLDDIFPLANDLGGPRLAAISTCQDVYDGIPYDAITTELNRRNCTVSSTIVHDPPLEPGKYFDIFFTAK